MPHVPNSEQKYGWYIDLPIELVEYEETLKINCSANKSTMDETAKATAVVWHYPTFAEGKLRFCFSKSGSKFESWEKMYKPLEDCCDIAFGWDYYDGIK